MSDGLPGFAAEAGVSSSWHGRSALLIMPIGLTQSPQSLAPKRRLGLMRLQSVASF